MKLWRGLFTENEVCKNCGRAIGKLEQVFVYKDHVVCKECNLKLRDEPQEIVVQSGSSPATADTVFAKPGKVTAIGGMRIGAGVCNILAGIVFFWLVLPLAMIALGVIEIVSASNLLKSRPARPSGLKTIAILEIVALLTFAGWISAVVGIITLVFLADPRVKEYLSRL